MLSNIIIDFIFVCMFWCLTLLQETTIDVSWELSLLTSATVTVFTLIPILWKISLLKLTFLWWLVHMCLRLVTAKLLLYYSPRIIFVIRGGWCVYICNFILLTLVAVTFLLFKFSVWLRLYWYSNNKHLFVLCLFANLTGCVKFFKCLFHKQLNLLKKTPSTKFRLTYLWNTSLCFNLVFNLKHIKNGVCSYVCMKGRGARNPPGS